MTTVHCKRKKKSNGSTSFNDLVNLQSQPSCPSFYDHKIRLESSEREDHIEVLYHSMSEETSLCTDDGPLLPLAASITLTPADYRDDASVWVQHTFPQTYTSQWGFKAERITYLKKETQEHPVSPLAHTVKIKY